MAAINVNVSQLSDVDLRERLQSLGENVGPVTGTTRGILEKKLSNILSHKNDNNVLNSVSSLEDDTEKRKSVASKTKRMSAPGVGRKSTTRKFAPFSSDEEEVSYHTDNSRKIPNKSKNEFVDPNDTNISIIPSSSTNSVGQIPLNTRNKRRSLPNNLPTPSPATTPVVSGNVETSTKSLRNEFSDDDFFPRTESPIHNITLNTTKRSTPMQNMIGSRYRNSELPNNISDSKYPSYQSKPEQLNRSRYTKFTSTSIDPNNTSVSNMRDEIDASLIQIRNSYTTKKPSPTSKCSYDDEKEKEEDEDDDDAEFVSEEISYIQMFRKSITGFKMIPLIIAFLLIGLYLYNGDVNGLLGISNKSDFKDDGQNHHYEFINCVYQKLSALAGNADCGYIENKWVKSDYLQEFSEPCLVNKGTPTNKEIIDILNSTEYINYFGFSENGEVSSKSSYRPLSCRINQALSVIVFRILMLVTVISCVIGGYFIMKKRWTADDEEMRQVLHFVERIIDTLQRHHEVCQTNKDLPPFLPIPHVRDMLIPLAKRKKMAKIWRKAVAFLNSSDSRVRVETQRIAGEDFDVWRWIGVCTPKLKKEKKATSETYLTNDQDKCWQGPAFDEIEKVVRMPIVTPTPCLKIRYMHEGLEEKDDKWVKRVENAVLEKCNLDGAQILHIFVDKTSKEGCVYVKCDSLESAGKAFRCMYGNWFDCRLVIVKFVTLARYHQRFPDALRCAEPLKPDSDMPSSLNWVTEDNK